MKWPSLSNPHPVISESPLAHTLSCGSSGRTGTRSRSRRVAVAPCQLADIQRAVGAAVDAGWHRIARHRRVRDELDDSHVAVPDPVDGVRTGIDHPLRAAARGEHAVGIGVGKLARNQVRMIARPHKVVMAHVSDRVRPTVRSRHDQMAKRPLQPALQPGREHAVRDEVPSQGDDAVDPTLRCCYAGGSQRERLGLACGESSRDAGRQALTRAVGS